MTYMVTYVTCQTKKLTALDFVPSSDRLFATADSPAIGPLTLSDAVDTVASLDGTTTRAPMHNLKIRVAALLVACFAMFALTGCGHSEDEWQQAQRDIAKLKADLDASRSEERRVGKE